MTLNYEVPHSFPLGHKWQENLPSFQQSLSLYLWQVLFHSSTSFPLLASERTALTVSVRVSLVCLLVTTSREKAWHFPGRMPWVRKPVWYLNRVTDMRRCSGRAAATPVPGRLLPPLYVRSSVYKDCTFSADHTSSLGTFPAQHHPYTHGLFFQECW